MKILICALFVLFSLCPYTGHAQKSLIKIADAYFDAEKYAEAATIYESQEKKVAKDTRLLIRRGIAHYYSNNPDGCIRDMEAARQLKTRDVRIYRYAGLSYFVKGQYATASEFLKAYLSRIKTSHKDFDHTVIQIRRCGMAMKLKYDNPIAFVLNAGSEINSVFDDFAPVQSPTRQNRIYFSSAREGTEGGLRDKNGLENPVTGKYAADIFYSDSESGLWSPAVFLDRLIQTAKHEVIQGFNPDGTILYYLQTHDLVTGQILTDTFGTEKDIFTASTPAKIPVNAAFGDKDLQVFSDSLLIFSAVRPEGYGGYDLYYVQKRGYTWESPVNFGPVINSPYDDISPFMTKNGKVLYFSSDRPGGVGGFDIFRVAFNDQFSDWDNPQNLAVPVNSTLNDVDWSISADGTTGYFSSDRLGSYGGKDIYIAHFNDQEINQLDYTEEPDFLTRIPALATGVSESPESMPARPRERIEVPVRDFVASPLYYKPNEDVLTPQNIILLKRIIELMQIFPEIKLVLTAHTLDGPRPEVDVFFSAKLLEKASDYLRSGGVAANRIILQSCGSYFPIAKSLINGIPSNLALRYNHRIDVHFVNIPKERLRVKSDIPVISEDFKDSSWEMFASESEGITFRIELAYTSQMYSGDIFGMEAPVIMYKTADQQAYLYTAGNFTEYFNALALKKLLVNKGCQNCQITVFYNGIKLSDSELAVYADDFPELKKIGKEE